MRRLLFLLTLLAACEDELARKTENAAERVQRAASAAELEEVQADYAYLRSLRVQALRAEHSVAESQPLVIVVLAQARGLLPSQMRRVDESLAIFRERLAHTRQLIDDLQHVPAVDWERRDDEVGRAMAELFVARDASWQALEGEIDDGDFPQT